MLTLEELLNRRVQLPPISSMQSGIPPVCVVVPHTHEIQPIQSDPEPLCPTGQYTVKDDLSIIRAIASFYGNNYTGKIPWSFWQTYKKATGSERSTSSLYHHWNGSMMKKYCGFIQSGRYGDCVKWLETGLAVHSGTGAPLIQQHSEPPMAIYSSFGSTLIRTRSAMNASQQPL